MGIDAKKLFEILNSEEINKLEPASTILDIEKQTETTLLDTKNLINTVTIEQAIKHILWNGIWNQYGIYGKNRDKPKIYKTLKDGKKVEKSFYNERYSRGKLLSIDFGTSNIGRELSFTHAGIVLADYVGITVVVPITSQKEYGLSKLSSDIQKVVIPIYKNEYPSIGDDSYILVHQIRAVSKNRITKVIMSFSKTDVMKQIEEKLLEIHTPYIKKIYTDEIIRLKDEVSNLKKLLDKESK